jgi:hypothetical protein
VAFFLILSMPTQKFTFEVTSQMTLEYTHGATSSSLQDAFFNLRPLKPLDKSIYLDDKRMPRKKALKPITNTLVASLIAHVRASAIKGWMKEGDHMEYIMKQLQGIFVTPGEMIEDTFKDDK